MRRLLSILLLLGLGMGPAAEAVTVLSLQYGLASGWTGKVDEARLPACCRRNGRHHCSMGAAALPDGEISLSASDSCPYAPHALVAMAAPSGAVVAAPVVSAGYGCALRVRYGAVAAPRTSARRSQPKRGPPALLSL